MLGGNKILSFIFILLLSSCYNSFKSCNLTKIYSDQSIENILSYIYKNNCNECDNNTLIKNIGYFSQSSIDSFIEDCNINKPPILPSYKEFYYTKYIKNICLILEKQRLSINGSSYYLLPDSIDNRDGIFLCSNDYFKIERGFIGGRTATGVAINDSTIVTIKHATSFLDSLVFIFGNYIQFYGEYRDTFFVDINNIYYGNEMTDISTSNDYESITFLGLSGKKINNVVDININSINKNCRVYAMGYPLGTTLKIHTDGLAYFNCTEKIQKTTLNLYTHNSGSPVFDVKTNNLIGIVSNAPNCQIISQRGNCCYRSRNTCKKIGLSYFYRF